ncbi:MAG: aconitase X catalytic domain-containing protein [Theionarchaea archaeon]|nr:aconitase X catalytic domain-containing protein [Theionarchaea archaeon]
MNLSDEHEAILIGRKGETLQKCLKTLVKYGQFFSAETLVPIRSAHLVMSSGSILFKTYLDIVEQLVREGIQFAVPTTINPHFTTDNPGVIQKYVLKNDNVFREYFRQLGGIETYSCTPYLCGNVPRKGDVISWAESSAVIYANSVLGARTNRNSGILDLISAVLGVTPSMGLLLDENRKGTVEVLVETDIGHVDFPVLGYLIGKVIPSGIPYIRGLQGTQDDFKNMGAAMAASGGVGLFHVEGVTPEARALGEDSLRDDADTISITDETLSEQEKELSAGSKRADMVFIGCPHLSYGELVRVSRLLEGTKIRKGVKLLVNTSDHVRKQFMESEHVESLERTGASLVSLCPLALFETPSLRRRSIVTNSGKMRYYAPVYYRSLDTCLEEAVGGFDLAG